MRLDNLKKQAHEALKEGDIESSWRPISDGLNIAWEDAELLYMAGVFFRQKGHVGLASHLFRRCVALDHNQANPWLHFGSCLHDLHHYDEAIQAFKVAQGLAPNDASPVACSAASHVQKGNFLDALNLADKAIAMSPDYKVPHIAKAIACLGDKRIGKNSVILVRASAHSVHRLTACVNRFHNHKIPETIDWVFCSTFFSIESCPL